MNSLTFSAMTAIKASGMALSNEGVMNSSTSKMSLVVFGLWGGPLRRNRV